MTDYSNPVENSKYLKYLEQEKRLADMILNHSKSMISIINRNYIYEKVNATFCNAHRCIMDSVVGKSLSDFWGYENFRDNIKENVDKCFSGNLVMYEASFTIPQSGKRYFEVVFRPFNISNGEVTHLIAETSDISDLKLSELTASEIQEELRVFETNLPIGFLRCNRNGRITHANRTFLTIMGCFNEDCIKDRNLKDYYSEQDLFDIHLEQLFSEGKKNFGRVELKTNTNDKILCRISGFMGKSKVGEEQFLDFAFEDMSRELMLENRLQQSQKLETIGVLAGGIAHDFNNILATISGYSEMLRDDLPKSSDGSEKVTKILAAVTKARSLIGQILTFSRQVEQEKVTVNVYEILSETIGFIKSAAPKIQIKIELQEKNSIVFADPTQLFRVFLNLMTNAVQAMEEMGGIITVKSEVVDGKDLKDKLSKAIVADEYINISFADTGKGMDPSLVQRIFEPFYTTREVGKGYGLGLSVVYGIVSEMEGEIIVSSLKDHGSEFSVYLPISREYNKPMDNRHLKKILFITGNRYESRILSIAIESAGFALTYASDQKHLTKILSDPLHLPDLIIYMSDSQKINTKDMALILRKLNLSIPCILITGAEQDLLDEGLVNSGFIKQYLIKPVSLKEIKTAIQLSL